MVELTKEEMSNKTVIGLTTLTLVVLLIFFYPMFFMSRGEYLGIPVVSDIEKTNGNTYEIKFGFRNSVVALPYEGELPEYVAEGNKVILTYTLDPPKILDIAPEGGRASTGEVIIVLSAIVAISLVIGFLLFKKPGWCKE